MMTINSGIRKIRSDSDICDFEFDPCGYSMNAIEGSAISTIHVTPCQKTVSVMQALKQLGMI